MGEFNTEKEKNGAHLRHSEGKVIQRSRTRKVCQMAKGVTQSPAKYKAEHKGGGKKQQLSTKPT